jgi:phospholipid/cholesterol/gamma-HCH transport system permease protein
MNLHPVHYGALAVHPFSGTHKQKVESLLCIWLNRPRHVVVHILGGTSESPSFSLFFHPANRKRQREEALSKRQRVERVEWTPSEDEGRFKARRETDAPASLAKIRRLNYGVVQMMRLLQVIGQHGLAIAAGFGDFALFASRAFAATPTTRQLGRRWVRAVHEIGVRCVPVVLVVGLFTGLVLGLQGYYVLARFGSTGLLGTLVSLTLARELAPVLGALMIVGQAGSAIAAEIGIHRNSEQIDALTIMGVDPLGYLITPRLFAALLVFPILTVAFTFVGLVGGYLSGSVLLGLDAGVYWSAVHYAIRVADVRECLLKALVFGVITIAICCHSGFTTHRRTGVAGSRAVSLSTIRGVVFASIATLAVDYLITSFLV